MRAAEPISAGRVERDGVRVGYEVFGIGEPTILLMPTWCIVHSRIWKMQIPYLARHHRVVTFDGPGNGRADRPTGPVAYTAEKHVDLALAVLDVTKTDRAIAVASSGGTHRTVLLAAEHPDRVEGAVFVGPHTPLVTDAPNERTEAFTSGAYELYLQLFMTAAFTEPHSTKAIEDGIGWGHETSLATIADARAHPSSKSTAAATAPTCVTRSLSACSCASLSRPSTPRLDRGVAGRGAVTAPGGSSTFPHL
jgi:pimeloyl-ACP methyl ester carboxylesterase